MNRWRDQQGSAVAEIVVILPALLLLLSMVVSLLSAITLQIRCREVATSVARALERGEPDLVWQGFAQSALPDAHIEIHPEAGHVLVTVSQKSVLNLDVKGEAVALP